MAAEGPGSEEEMFLVDEFSWDVYEARARLDERIKAAAGLALFRDGIAFAELALPDEPVEEEGGVPPLLLIPPRAQAEERAYLAGSSITSPAKSPGREDPEAGTDALEPGIQVVSSRENVRTDMKALVPPRVNSTGNLTEESTNGSTLLVGPSEMNETWVLLDGFRVRVEMLPGGLLPERDKVFEELNFLLSGLETWSPAGQDGSMPSFLQLSEMVRFSERVKQLEDIYMAWASDEEAPPQDDASKQRVRDWLGPSGEKDVALDILRSSGARRCKGPDPEGGVGCLKLLRFELYKCCIQRCPTCKQAMKQAVVATGNQKLTSTEGSVKAESAVVDTGAFAGYEGAFIDARKKKQVAIQDRFIGVIEVEAREKAFALFLAEINSYYPALVLPSDLEFCRVHDEPVTVSWMDGDTNHREVPPTEVILLTEWQAEDVVNATVSHWDNRVGKLLPGGDAQGEFSFGAVDPS